MNNTKTYKRYIEITPLEGLQMLVDSGAKPVQVAVRNNNDDNWSNDTLKSVDIFEDGFPFNALEFGYNSKCARVIETDPRQVPEGVNPLPHEWLAYVPFDLRIDWNRLEPVWYMDEDGDDYWCNNDGAGWDMQCCVTKHHYAIDVRSDFAKEHFPQIVEAMNYQDEEAFTNPDLGKAWSAFDEWFDSKLDGMIDGARNHYREAYELGQQNPLK